MADHQMNIYDGLPIEQYVTEILKRVRANQVTILVGETGSGKSTIVPQILAEDAKSQNIKPRILCSQPRRIAAQKLAKRVNETYEAKHGIKNFAGYRVKSDKQDEDCAIVYATTGYLVEWFRHNNDALDNVTHLILDESHERTIDMDILTLMMKRSILKRPFHPIRIVIMSATMDIHLYTTYFTLAGVKPLEHIYVGTNRFEVEDCFIEDLVGVKTIKKLVDFDDQNVTDDFIFNFNNVKPDKSSPTTTTSSSSSLKEQKEVTMYCLDDEWRYEDFWTSIEGLKESRAHIGETIPKYDTGSKCLEATPTIADDFYELGVYLAIWLCKIEGLATWQVAYNKLLPETMNAFNSDGNVNGQGAYIPWRSAGLDNDWNPINDEAYGSIGYDHEYKNIDGLGYHEPQSAHDSSESTCILVFLPGENEQLHWYEWYTGVMEYQQAHVQSQAQRRITVHMLHSKAEKEEFEAAFKTGPPGTCRIILATNIAESSITIPDVKFVIDYGLRRAMEYNVWRGTQQLCLGYISRASRIQRRGRAGRCSAGKIFSLYTKRFSEAHLRKHENPEIFQCSLETTILRIRQLFPEDAAKAVLNQMIQPPDTQQVDHAIQRLIEVGALLKPIYQSKNYNEAQKEGIVTYLGIMAAKLPITLVESRVILIGSAMGAPLESVVLAAALNGPDIFSMPSSKFQRDQAKFASMMASSFGGRMTADGGSMSEPMGVLRVFEQWLGIAEAEVRAGVLHELNVNLKRFREFRLGVKMLATALASVMKSQIEEIVSNRDRKRSARTYSITSKQLEEARYTVERLQRLASLSVPEQLHHSEGEGALLEVDYFFNATSDCLRVILVMSCAPQILYGVAPKPAKDINLANELIGRAGMEAYHAWMAEQQLINAPPPMQNHDDNIDDRFITNNRRKDRQTERRRAKIEQARQRSDLAGQWFENSHQTPLGDDPRLVHFHQFVYAADVPRTDFPDLYDGLRGYYALFDPNKCVILDLKTPSSENVVGSKLRQYLTYQQPDNIRANLQWIGVSRAQYVPRGTGTFFGDMCDKIVLEFVDGPQVDVNGEFLNSPLIPLKTEHLRFSSPIGQRFAAYMTGGYPASFRLAVYDFENDYYEHGSSSSRLSDSCNSESISLDIAKLRVPNLIVWKARRFLGGTLSKMRIFPYFRSVLNSLTVPPRHYAPNQPIGIYCAVRSTTVMGKDGSRIALTGATVFVADLAWHLRLVALSTSPAFVSIQFAIPVDSDTGNDNITDSENVYESAEKPKVKITGISHEFGLPLLELSREDCPESYLKDHYMIPEEIEILNRARKALARTLLTGEGFLTGSLEETWIRDLRNLAEDIQLRPNLTELQDNYLTSILPMQSLWIEKDEVMEDRMKLLSDMMVANMNFKVDEESVCKDFLADGQANEGGSSSNGFPNGQRDATQHNKDIVANQEVFVELGELLDQNGIRINDDDDYNSEILFPSFVLPKVLPKPPQSPTAEYVTDYDDMF